MNIIVDTNVIANLCRQEGIAYLGLFGSHARGEAKKTSDVDVLVDFHNTKSLFQLARVQQELEDYFHKKVDLVLRKSLKETIRPYVYNDLQTLYEEK